MELHALIPIKSLTHAKSRLAKHLTQEQRNTLVISMLDHVLRILNSCNKITKITVVTPDEKIKKRVLNKDVFVEIETQHGHNESLTQAAKKETYDTKLLTLSADLPLLNKKDLEEMIQLSQDCDVVIAPSKDNGTNAILEKSPLILPYLFGINSFENYKNESEKRKLSFKVYKSETISFDVDTPVDLKMLPKYLV